MALCAFQHYSSWPHLPTIDASPPRLSAFINSCCGVRLHSMTSGVKALPEVPAGQLKLQIQQGSVRGHVSSVCFPFLLCLFRRSHPWSSPTDCATGTLSHIYPHRKAYCTLNKQLYFQMITGYTLAYRNWYCLCDSIINNASVWFKEDKQGS